MGPSMSVCHVFPAGVGILHDRGVIVVQQWETIVIPIVIVSVVCSCCYCYSMALPSPGWTPHCLYDLRLDHPGLRRTGTALDGVRHPRGYATFWDCGPFGEPPGGWFWFFGFSVWKKLFVLSLKF
jgi:hypothetical protein